MNDEVHMREWYGKKPIWTCLYLTFPGSGLEVVVSFRWWFLHTGHISLPNCIIHLLDVGLSQEVNTGVQATNTHCRYNYSSNFSSLFLVTCQHCIASCFRVSYFLTSSCHFWKVYCCQQFDRIAICSRRICATCKVSRETCRFQISETGSPLLMTWTFDIPIRQCFK